LSILQSYQSQWGARLVIRQGPMIGFCANFLGMACDASIEADYYAFCDQDDVWLPEKLEAGIVALSLEHDSGLPLLYCGRTLYVTESLQPCGESEVFSFPKKFRNALVQSVAGGNTMVFYIT